MKYIIPILLVVYLFGTTACNSVRIVRPLAKKEVAVGLDFGGPIIDFSGLKIPVPFSSITAAYGVDSTVTVFGSAYITSAIFGTIHWDMGVVKEILKPQRGFIPGLSVGLNTQMMVDVFKGNFRLYPILDVNLYWQYLPKHQHYFYLNWGSWFDFWSRAHGQINSSIYYPSLALGHTFENKKMRYTLEVKFIAPNIDNGGTPLQFNGTEGKGSWGAYISVFRKF